MSKIFVYMYPIEENVASYFMSPGAYSGISPYSVLNECIQKRYKDNGYKVVGVVYKDKDSIYGIKDEIIDQIINSDLDYNKAQSDDINDYQKKRDNARKIIQELGENIERVVVGGYFAMNSVREIAQTAVNAGISAGVDLDLTEFFADLYKQEGFKIEEYNPDNFKELWLTRAQSNHKDNWESWRIHIEKYFNQQFANPIFGFAITRETNSSPDNSDIEK